MILRTFYFIAGLLCFYAAFYTEFGSETVFSSVIFFVIAASFHDYFFSKTPALSQKFLYSSAFSLAIARAAEGYEHLWIFLVFNALFHILLMFYPRPGLQSGIFSFVFASCTALQLPVHDAKPWLWLIAASLLFELRTIKIPVLPTLFTIAALISVFFSVYPFNSVCSFLDLCAMLVLFCAARELKNLKFSIHTLFWANVLCVFLCIAEWTYRIALFGSFILFKSRPFYGHIQSIGMSAYLVLSTLLMTGTALCSKKHRILYFTISLLNVLIIFLSIGRTALVALAAGVFILSALTLKKRLNLFISLGIPAICVIAVILLSPSEKISRIASTDFGIQSRLSMYEDTLHMILAAPFTGHGYRNREYVYKKYLSFSKIPRNKIDTNFFIHPHNMLLDVWSSAGIISAAILCILIILVSYHVLKSRSFFISAVCGSIFAALFLLNCADSFLWQNGILTFSALVFPCILRHGIPAKKHIRKTAFLFSAAVLILTIAYAFKLKGTYYIGVSEWQTAQKALRISSLFNPADFSVWYNQYVCTLNQKEYTEAEHYITEAVNINPYYGMLHNMRGELLFVENKTEQAAEEIQKACELSFFHEEQFLFNLFLIYKDTNQDYAFSCLQQAGIIDHTILSRLSSEDLNAFISWIHEKDMKLYAYALYYAKKYNECIQLLKSPDDNELFFDIFYSLSKYKKAMEYADNSPSGITKKAKCLYYLKDFDNSESMFLDAIKKWNYFPFDYHNLEAYRYLFELTGDISWLLKAAFKNNDERLLYLIAESYGRTNNISMQHYYFSRLYDIMLKTAGTPIHSINLIMYTLNYNDFRKTFESSGQDCAQILNALKKEIQ